VHLIRVEAKLGRALACISKSPTWLWTVYSGNIWTLQGIKVPLDWAL